MMESLRAQSSASHRIQEAGFLVSRFTKNNESYILKYYRENNIGRLQDAQKYIRFDHFFDFFHAVCYYLGFVFLLSIC